MDKIIHVDMDAFYAAVEIRDNPQLINKPVIIGGPPNSRSVVCTANYLARTFGVHSAMPSSQARRLCPKGVFIIPRMEVYKGISKQIHQIFYRYTELVEPLSLDEAYLDVSHNQNPRGATGIAENIKREIFQNTGLTASAGVSINKFLAKVASDWDKPNGLTVIKPSMAQQFLWDLPIGKFWGIGNKTQQRMAELNIRTGKDLYQYPLFQLIHLFGKSGSYYYNIVRGNDSRRVEINRERKSLGKEITFNKDIHDFYELFDKTCTLLTGLNENLSKKNLKPKTLTIKIRYSNFEIQSKRVDEFYFLDDLQEQKEKIHTTLLSFVDKERAIRLVGLTFSNFAHANQTKEQLLLF